MPYAAGLYWEDHGPDGALPVILCSGLGGGAAYWRPNIAALAAAHKVIAYDHRGTGRSEPSVGGDLTIEAMAADLALLMDAIGVPRATILGHAVGGMIGLALAMAEPARVDRLAVINGWAWLDPHTARCFDTRLALLRGGGPRAFLHATPLFLYPAEWISAHHDQLLAEEEEQFATFPGVEMTVRRIAAARRFAPGDRLARIAAPALFVSADDDMLVPAHCSAALAAAIPGARHARLATGGHACNITRADQFNAWLADWLSE